MTAPTVYLLHFERPIGDLANPRGQARHYIGYTVDLVSRLAEHERGSGAALMRAVSLAGVSWQLVRTWEGDRTLERKLKNWHKARQLCPICNAVRSEPHV